MLLFDEGLGPCSKHPNVKDSSSDLSQMLDSVLSLILSLTTMTFRLPYAQFFIGLLELLPRQKNLNLKTDLSKGKAGLRKHLSSSIN